MQGHAMTVQWFSLIGIPGAAERENAQQTNRDREEM
jgi:hypothetical protein